MTPVDDHISLDLCAQIARQIMMELKGTVLAVVGNLQTAEITPKKLNEIAALFERITGEILDDAISTPRTWIPSTADWQAGRVAYFREQSRSE